LLSYFYLAIAILAETIATTFLKSSDSFRNLVPSIIVIIGYSIAFYSMSLTLRDIPVGVVYATWSGLGIVLISFAAYFFHKQALDAYAVIGIALIILGVLIINLLSKSSAHG